MPDLNYFTSSSKEDLKNRFFMLRQKQKKKHVRALVCISFPKAKKYFAEPRNVCWSFKAFITYVQKSISFSAVFLHGPEGCFLEVTVVNVYDLYFCFFNFILYFPPYARVFAFLQSMISKKWLSKMYPLF